MNKVYSRINWENEPSTKTPLNEHNLNKIDFAVDEIDNRVIELDSTKAKNTDLQTLSTRVDNLILNAGDSSAECTDARVTEDGTTYDTLKKRLDAEHSSVIEDISQLSNEIERRILGCNITEYKKVNCYSEGGKLVYNDTSVKSIYFKCDKHTIYSITKTLGNYFSVFFTDELPANGVTTYLSTLSKETTNIIVDSLEHEYCIIWYWFVNDTETVENILSTISIEAIGTNERVAVLEASVSANEAKINDLTDIVESQNFVCREYNLPILYLTGDTDGMSKDIKKTLSYQYKNKKGSCTVKWQGSSSIAYPKKNYTIVFDNDFEVKSGWGKHKKYCLKANWIDFSHSRNIVSARLWGEMVKNRVDTEPVYTITTENGEELLTELSEEITTYNNRLATKPNGGAIDGFPICVVINNVYQGIYTFNIPKDDWLFGMGSGGNECILCAEGSSSGVMFTGEALLDGTDFSIEYITDETNIEWAKASLNKLINLCVNCDSAEKYNEIKGYVDIQSAIDYYIFICLLEAEDCVFRNYILTTFDGVKWYFSAYDLDQTFGLGDGGKMFYDISNNRATNIDNLLHNNRLMYLIYKYDYASLKQRYEELRNSIMSENNVYSKFIGFTKDISLALKNEEVKIWSGIPSTDVNNVSQILDFYRLRVIDQDKKIIE